MSEVKKIGIDARFYGEAGPGRYAKAIVEHLEKVDKENEYTVFLRKKGLDNYKPKNPNFHKRLAEYKWYSWGEQIGFLYLVMKHKPDLLYVPHFNIPIFYTGKIVTAIPDIIMHTFSTEKGTTLPKPYFKLKKLIYKFVVKWAVIRSEKVIVPSESVIDEFRQVFPSVPREKYVLAYEGVDPDFLKIKPNYAVIQKSGIRQPFLLYVGSMYEHKNLDRLIEAYEILINDYGFVGQLVLVGKKDKFSEIIYTKVKMKGLEDKVIMPGMRDYITDAELVGLRQKASLYVFPSLKEGFSLTPLEAQSAGLPCVISDISVHKEIYGNSVRYFDPQDPENIAEKIYDVLTDKESIKKLISKGHEQVYKYSWINTAVITKGVFDEVLSKKR